MRTVTITRHKTFVGCAGTLKIYISDPAGELVINDIPCRQLGLLKNGKTETFYIDEEAHRLFFIFDKISRNYCNEFTDIAPGMENVILSGKNHYNPAAGNPFRLDGLASAEVLENRRRGTRKGVVIFIVAILVGFAIGFGLTALPRMLTQESTEPKTFTEGGISITLTEAFKSDPTEGYEAYYLSRRVGVMIVKGEMTKEELALLSLPVFAEILIEESELDATVQTKEGLTCFEYDSVMKGDDYRHLVIVLKSDTAVWSVEMYTFKEDYEKKLPTFLEWAKSVTFE